MFKIDARKPQLIKYFKELEGFFNNEANNSAAKSMARLHYCVSIMLTEPDISKSMVLDFLSDDLNETVQTLLAEEIIRQVEIRHYTSHPPRYLH